MSGFLGAGTSGADPISNYGIIWTIVNNSNKPDEQLKVENDTINGIICIRDAIYQLKTGNLFLKE